VPISLWTVIVFPVWRRITSLSPVSPIMLRNPLLEATVMLPDKSVRSSRRSIRSFLRKWVGRRFSDMGRTPPGKEGLGVEAYLGALAICQGGILVKATSSRQYQNGTPWTDKYPVHESK